MNWSTRGKGGMKRQEDLLKISMKSLSPFPTKRVKVTVSTEDRIRYFLNYGEMLQSFTNLYPY